VTEVLYREQRWVAVPDDHHLAGRETVSWTELLDEPFIALPRAAGNLREFWLAIDQRPADRSPRVIAEAANAEETFELIAAGQGVALLSAGNARIYQRPGVRTLAVTDLPPSAMAIARRGDDQRLRRLPTTPSRRGAERPVEPAACRAAPLLAHCSLADQFEFEGDFGVTARGSPCDRPLQTDARAAAGARYARVPGSMKLWRPEGARRGTVCRSVNAPAACAASVSRADARASLSVDGSV
jgi:hypothetical protein